jgi:hypothetical protein
VVMHVYLTTTSHSPFTSIQAMMVGWDEIEVFELTEEEAVS